MSYNADLPVDNTADIRENFRALKEDKIVAANTAATLETARTINGVSFDGSADIVITQVDGINIATVDDVSATFDAGYSFETDGYQKLSNGLILQWCRGISSTADQASQVITFPTSFPSTCLSIQVSDYVATGSNSKANMWWQIIGLNASSATVVLQSAQETGGSHQPFIYAIGY